MCDRNITAAPATFERVSKIKNIKIIYDFIVNEITISHNSIDDEEQHKIVIFRKTPKDNKARLLWISADGFFVAIGMKPNIAPLDIFLHCWDENGHIITDSNCRTKHRGLFAAGDIRQKQVRQAITAAADGAIAVQGVINYLNEN